MSVGNKMSIFDTVSFVFIGTFASCGDAKLAFPAVCEREGKEGGKCCLCCNSACPGMSHFIFVLFLL